MCMYNYFINWMITTYFSIIIVTHNTRISIRPVVLINDPPIYQVNCYIFVLFRIKSFVLWMIKIKHIGFEIYFCPDQSYRFFWCATSNIKLHMRVALRKKYSIGFIFTCCFLFYLSRKATSCLSTFFSEYGILIFTTRLVSLRWWWWQWNWTEYTTCRFICICHERSFTT